MFTASLERVLNVAAREALARRRADLTLELLLFAADHDPMGEEILAASGADSLRLKKELDQFLEEQVDELPSGSRKAPQQTLAFRRVLQTAVVHSQGAGKAEADVGDILAALMREPRPPAAELLAAQDVTRLDLLNYISHGVRKNPLGDPALAPGGDGEEGPAGARDPLEAYASNPTQPGPGGKFDPLIGPAREVKRAPGGACPPPQNT